MLNLDSASFKEQQRLFLLGCTGLLDTPTSEGFDRITRLAAQLFDVPIALVSLVDERRQWFKSRHGLETQETARTSSFCHYTIERDEVLVIEDALGDSRFADNPLVLGEPRIRFYAGAPLTLQSGYRVGSLCLIDQKPRSFSVEERARLVDMAALVMVQIDLHQKTGRVAEVTRLPNRAQLADDLEALCNGGDGKSAALMLLDVMTNAQLQAAVRALGVAPFEATMREVARTLKALLGAGTALYHVGVTRFAFLLPADSRQAHDEQAGRILARLHEPFANDGISIELESRAGLVDFPLTPTAAGDALRKAASAMHEAVIGGRTWVWHDECFDANHRRAYALSREISPGLQRGEFRLVFQPQLALNTGTYSCVEALARWKHPVHGDISPSEFIPLVESAVLIHEFTHWVLNTALAQVRAWHDEGQTVSMAINVSSRNLDHPAFVQTVRDACTLHGVSPIYLHIECTENSVMTNAVTQSALEALRDMGAEISLDDFGMGFSNFACLSTLPVQLLKLDQSLIRPIASQPRALQLVKSLIHLGHTLGYRMLGEGVETDEVLALLTAAGCDAVQGYFLCRPLESAAALTFLKRQRVNVVRACASSASKQP